MFEFSLTDLAAEARREVLLRRHVYKGLVAKGRLSQDKADRQIRMMEIIAEVIECVAEEKNTEDTA